MNREEKRHISNWSLSAPSVVDFFKKIKIKNIHWFIFRLFFFPIFFLKRTTRQQRGRPPFFFFAFSRARKKNGRDQTELATLIIIFFLNPVKLGKKKKEKENPSSDLIQWNAGGTAHRVDRKKNSVKLGKLKKK